MQHPIQIVGLDVDVENGTHVDAGLLFERQLHGSVMTYTMAMASWNQE
jgi:hypothetical protein